ncbi:MAG: rhodanese-like domain-containing protein [Elusimicrobiota bacterium]
MPKIPEISVEELKERIRRGDKFILLDVREHDEHKAARIPGSVHIPLGELEECCDKLDKSSAIAVHCRSGGRSAKAVEFLCAKGYSAVNVAGGILAWTQRIDPTLTMGPGQHRPG